MTRDEKFELVTFITSRLLLALTALGFLRMIYPVIIGNYHWFFKILFTSVDVLLIGFFIITTLDVYRVDKKLYLSWNINEDQEDNCLLCILLLFFLPLILAMCLGVVNRIIHQEELLDFIKSMESIWGPY